MIRLRIDNIETEARQDQTILDVARNNGIFIPVLCHADQLEPCASCMICVVKNKKSNTYVPSCTALVEEGMDIDASGSEVRALRQRTLELLFSEHRAECEAPCRVACPEGYNIPLMNRLLSSGKVKDAVELTLAETAGKHLRCYTCKGYCENACRRKKIDLPVSIRNLKIFVYETIAKDKIDNPSVYRQSKEENDTTEGYILKRRFSSRTGKLDDTELKEGLKECTVAIQRNKEINDFNSAGPEAASCMHCDCRAGDNCKLRELASLMQVKDKLEKVTGVPVRKKVNNQTGLVFENAKCIKCGLCVRICEDTSDAPALCFLNRGFVSLISEPLTAEFDDILKEQAEKCVNICPTGALGWITD